MVGLVLVEFRTLLFEFFVAPESWRFDTVFYGFAEIGEIWGIKGELFAGDTVVELLGFLREVGFREIGSCGNCVHAELFCRLDNGGKLGCDRVSEEFDGLY